MKFLLIASLSLASLSSWSNDKKHEEMEKKFNKMSFEDSKKMKSDMLAETKHVIDEAQACVNESKDKPALKKCMDKMHSDKKAMHEKMEEKMKRI